MAREQQCEAIVLRHMAYGEADLIVSLLSRHQGLMKCFARSAKKSQKRFSSSLQPFSQSVFQYRSGRGSLLTLLDADLVVTRSGLHAKLKTLACASYGVELIELLLVEGDAHEEVFILLAAFLDYLAAQGDAEVARVLIELRLIGLLGYLPHLLHCSSCNLILTHEPVRFDSLRGGSLCTACSGSSGLEVGLGTLGSLSRILRVPFSQFDGFRFGEQTLNEGRALLSQILRQHLSREPKSLKFMQQIGV